MPSGFIQRCLGPAAAAPQTQPGQDTIRCPQSSDQAPLGLSHFLWSNNCNCLRRKCWCLWVTSQRHPHFYPESKSNGVNQSGSTQRGGGATAAWVYKYNLRRRVVGGAVIPTEKKKRRQWAEGGGLLMLILRQRRARNEGGWWEAEEANWEPEVGAKAGGKWLQTAPTTAPSRCPPVHGGWSASPPCSVTAKWPAPTAPSPSCSAAR